MMELQCLGAVDKRDREGWLYEDEVLNEGEKVSKMCVGVRFLPKENGNRAGQPLTGLLSTLGGRQMLKKGTSLSIIIEQVIRVSGRGQSL